MNIYRTPMAEIRAFPRVGADTVRRLGLFAWDNTKGREASAREYFIVEKWARDCDHYESSSIEAIPACRRNYDKLMDDMADGAEGPWRVRVLPPEEVEGYEPIARDHVLEAFEDGHPWSVAL